MNKLNLIYKEIDCLIIMNNLLGNQDLHVQQKTIENKEIVLLSLIIKDIEIMCFYVEQVDISFPFPGDCYNIVFSRYDLIRDLQRLGHYTGKPYSEETLLSFIKNVFLLENF